MRARGWFIAPEKKPRGRVTGLVDDRGNAGGVRLQLESSLFQGWSKSLKGVLFNLLSLHDLFMYVLL